MTCASAIDGAIQRKKRGRVAIATKTAGAVRAGKWITLVVPNEDMDDIIRIIKSLENSGVFIDGVSETVKHEIKNCKVDFFYVIRNFKCSYVIKYVNWKRSKER